ncbi:MAG: helix-turn-helix transcriptional regulator [Chitinophagaceae bacterium]|nr:helix-turn-helix transcriptional regulator [Chitinophagaceae bacterium]
MHTFYIRPCPLLQPHIHSFVYTKFEQEESSFQLDQYPTGYTAIAYMLGPSPVETTDLSNDRIFRAKLYFTGQLKKFTPLRSASYSAVYVVFKPIGASHFLSDPLHCFTDSFTELADMMPYSPIYQRLVDCHHHPQLVITALEEWLLQLMQEKKKGASWKSSAAMPRLSAILKKMMVNKGKLSIEDICRDFHIPQRTLEVQFNNNIGISPKSFSRMLRINHAHKQCIVLKKNDWQEIIHECNYFDQAHFIKEFKTFFGYTPAGAPPGKWNLSAELLGYTENRPVPDAHTLFPPSIHCSRDKKNGSVTYATDPDIFDGQPSYLATFA